MEGLAELAFRRHHAQIYRYLRRRTGDADRAEDLAQEVFEHAAAALGNGDWQPASMLAWLHTIAQRRFADEARRRRYSANGVSFDDVLEEVPAPEYDQDLGRALVDAVWRLSPGQRQVVVMKLLRGWSFSDIASAVGVSEAAAKMRFQRALAALRGDLEQHRIGT
ncbi:MAG TPA: RNA polymerase sigma factor [Gaiellaceae bacterium]|nr:RNA polymerase sigma factor [Gaiellaceae bacterium]